MGVAVTVGEEPALCPICAGPMHVQKTTTRTAKTLEHGTFEAHETIHVCAAQCCHPNGALVTQRPVALSVTIMPRRSVSYDVMVLVGRERFLKHRQREEIRTTLDVEHGIRLSAGKISELATRFLDYYRRLHDAHREPLRAALANDGGWPLHIDATGESGRGVLLVVRTSWRGWVLGSWKVPTERAEVILPHLHSVVDKFGAPCAIMRDLGRAMIPACEDLLSERALEIPILSCHLHFLADIGSDLLDSAHSKLRGLFRRFKIRPSLRELARDLGHKLGGDIAQGRSALQTWQAAELSHLTLPEGHAGVAVVRALAQWVLDYPANSQYQSFPFDRPYLDFYERCLRVRRAVDALAQRHPADRKVRRALKRLSRRLDPVICEIPFAQVAATLRLRAKLFDELRDTLRLVPRTGSRNQTPPTCTIAPEKAIAELRDIKAALERFTLSIRERRPKRGPAQNKRDAIDIVLQHLETHGNSLWGHLISLPDDAGGGVRLVDRTNNSLEGFFRAMKHAERRRSGRKNLAQDFDHLPAEAALVSNLNCPDYVAIVCGSLDRLPRAFADLDAADRRKTLATPTHVPQVRLPPIPEITSTSLPTLDKRLIRTEAMQQRIDAAARSRAPITPPRPSGTISAAAG